MLIEISEFDIYEVKQALREAEAILKIVPEELDHYQGCGRRGEEPNFEHHLLLVMAIKGLISRLQKADEFLETPRDVEEKAAFKMWDEDAKEERLNQLLSKSWRVFERKKPNRH